MKTRWNERKVGSQLSVETAQGQRQGLKRRQNPSLDEIIKTVWSQRGETSHCWYAETANHEGEPPTTEQFTNTSHNLQINCQIDVEGGPPRKRPDVQ